MTPDRRCMIDTNAMVLPRGKWGQIFLRAGPEISVNPCPHLPWWRCQGSSSKGCVRNLLILLKLEVEMRTLTVTIDRSGCVTLPEQVLEALGVHALREVEVIIELTDKAVVIRPKRPVAPITEGIAAMNLPVNEWDQMEKEIDAGRLH